MKEPFSKFVEKRSFSFKPANALETTRGASKQAPMVLGHEKGKNKPKKMCFCYVYSKKAT